MPTTPDITVTVLAGERLSVSGDTPEFRKSLDMRVVDSGLTAASIYAALWHRGVKVAEFGDWTTGTGQLVATGSLNTTPLETAFDGLAAARIIPLELRIHDTDADGDLVASGMLRCRNNLEEGFDPPEDLVDDEYMRKSEYDADDDHIIDDSSLPPSHGGSGAAIYRDPWTLNSTHISNKYVSLTHAPDLRMLQLVIDGAGSQSYPRDFTVTIDPARLSWDGLSLDGVLEAGDKLTLEYTYTA